MTNPKASTRTSNLKILIARWIARLEQRVNEDSLRRFSLICITVASGFFVLGLPADTDMRTFVWGIAWLLVIAAIGTRMLRPHVEARTMVAQAARMVESGQYAQAVAMLNLAMSMSPYYAQAYIVRSAAYASMGQIDLAVDDADHAVQIAPRMPDARLARARVHSTRGLHDAALHDIRVALTERPDWAIGYLEMAQTYVQMQDYENSLAALKDISIRQQIAPTMRYEAMILAGWVYEEKLGDLDKAIASYSRAIPLLPDRKLGYLRRAFAYRERGDLHQYAEDLLRAAECRQLPEDKGQYNWLRAICYLRRYTVTQDKSDFVAWLNALEVSIREDDARFSAQARQMLDSLQKRSQRDSFPPKITFYNN